MKNPIIRTVSDAKAHYGKHSYIGALVLDCEANPGNHTKLLLLAETIESMSQCADASELKAQAEDLAVA